MEMARALFPGLADTKKSLENNGFPIDFALFMGYSDKKLMETIGQHTENRGHM